MSGDLNIIYISKRDSNVFQNIKDTNEYSIFIYVISVDFWFFNRRYSNESSQKFWINKRGEG